MRFTIFYLTRTLSQTTLEKLFDIQGNNVIVLVENAFYLNEFKIIQGKKRDFTKNYSVFIKQG